MLSCLPAPLLTSFLAQPASIQLKPPNSGWRVSSVGSLSGPILQSLPAQLAGIQLAIVLLEMKPLTVTGMICLIGSPSALLLPSLPAEPPSIQLADPRFEVQPQILTGWAAWSKGPQPSCCLASRPTQQACSWLLRSQVHSTKTVAECAP